MDCADVTVIDAGELSARKAFGLLKAAVVLLSLEYLGSGRLKDSAANIEATGEIVVNIAPAAMAPAHPSAWNASGASCGCWPSST